MNYDVAIKQGNEAEAQDGLERAMALIGEGRVAEAIAQLELLALDTPNMAEIHNALGNAYVLQGELKKALAAYELSSSLRPLCEEFILNIANVLHLMGDNERARQVATKAYELSPSSTEASFRLALLDMCDEEFSAAKKKLDEILKRNPKFGPALFQRSIIQLKRGKIFKAFEDVNSSIEQDPKNGSAFFVRGTLFLDKNHLEAAQIDFETAKNLGINDYELEKAQATLEYKKNNTKGALSKYITIYLKQKNDADILFNIGLIYLENGKSIKARLYFRKVLQLNPKHNDAKNGLANAFRHDGNVEKAIELYKEILQDDGGHLHALYNLAVIFLDLKDYTNALEYINNAIGISDKNIDYHLLKGRIYFESTDYKESFKIFESVINVQPENGEANLYLGHICRINRDLDSTIKFYEAALIQDPENIYLESDLLFSRLQVCDWSTLSYSWPKISEKLNDGSGLASPFFMVALSNDPEQQKKVAEAYSDGHHNLKDLLDPIEHYSGHKKIKIGYYSADYNNHATMHLMAGLFESHDREKFEIYAFSFGPKIIDEMRVRAEKAFDFFVDISELTDRAAALISRHFEIDIAVDLKGYTAHSRPGIFAYRAAPIQVNYLGFPGTMGAKYIDYIIADPIIIPKSHEKFYTEKVLRLPMCYQVNDQTRPPIERAFTRQDIGLPNDKFIYSSFNTNYKIMPETLESWGRILKAVPNSVIWILADNETAKNNIIREFSIRGVEEDRIFFAYRMDPKLNLARQDCADLFLDAFPCTAHTTASDAVFSGVPLLTMMGETFASRVAASVLSAVGLPDLITSSRREYEEKAIQLGNNPIECEKMSKYLRSTIRLTPLFETKQTARNLESLYMQTLRAQEKDEL